MGFRLTPVVQALLLTNVGVYFLMSFAGDQISDLFALYYPDSQFFKPYQIFTHMFMHANIMHLFSNMFALFMFGPMLEGVWGSKRFITFYLICGLGAAFFYTGIQYYEFNKLENQVVEYRVDPDPNTYGVILHHNFNGYQRIEEGARAFSIYSSYKENPTSQVLAKNSIECLDDLYKIKINYSPPIVGASGAIMGILMAFGMLFPNTEMIFIFLPIPIKAKYFVAFYGLYELYAGVHPSAGDNVAHFAHIGGMLFAFILIKYWQKKRNSFY